MTAILLCLCFVPSLHSFIHFFFIRFSLGTCDDPMGMEKGLISDAQLTASSAWSNNPKRYGAHRARLNLNTWPAGWSTKKFDPKPWLQIDLGTQKMVTGVATQGLGKRVGEWVKTYRVAYSDDGVTWHVLRNGGRKKVSTKYNHS